MCRRYGIDNSERTLHGALLDADLLAKVYLELLGGQEPSMLKEEKKASHATVFADHSAQQRVFREARSFPLSEEAKQLHLDFLAKILKMLFGPPFPKRKKLRDNEYQADYFAPRALCAGERAGFNGRQLPEMSGESRAVGY